MSNPGCPMAGHHSARRCIGNRPAGSAGQNRVELANAQRQESDSRGHFLDSNPVSRISSPDHHSRFSPLTHHPDSCRVIGLSVIRQIYVQRLLRASTDKSLSSTLTVILMEIEITYALASCTIATSRSFTDNFNTGWGMGQLRGAAEEYNLSNLGSGSRTMRKGTINMDTHTATITAGADKDMYPMVNRGRSVSLHRILNEGPQRDRNGMILRPEQNLHNESFVRSGRSGSEDGKSISGDSDELHILRQTEYSVSHDEAPILSRIHPLR